MGSRSGAFQHRAELGDPIGDMAQSGQVICERHVLEAVERDVEFVQRKQRVEIVVGEVLSAEFADWLRSIAGNHGMQNTIQAMS